MILLNPCKVVIPLLHVFGMEKSSFFGNLTDAKKSYCFIRSVDLSHKSFRFRRTPVNVPGKKSSRATDIEMRLKNDTFTGVFYLDSKSDPLANIKRNMLDEDDEQNERLRKHLNKLGRNEASITKNLLGDIICSDGDADEMMSIMSVAHPRQARKNTALASTTTSSLLSSPFSKATKFSSKRLKSRKICSI